MLLNRWQGVVFRGVLTCLSALLSSTSASSDVWKAQVKALHTCEVWYAEAHWVSLLELDWGRWGQCCNICHIILLIEEVRKKHRGRRCWWVRWWQQERLCWWWCLVWTTRKPERSCGVNPSQKGSYMNTRVQRGCQQQRPLARHMWRHPFSNHIFVVSIRQVLLRFLIPQRNIDYYSIFILDKPHF